MSRHRSRTLNIIESAAAITVEPGLPATASLILLHGLGADGDDFVPIAAELGLPDSVRYVFPRAPVQAVTINGGMKMRAWYDIISLTRGDRQDDAGTRASAAILMRHVDAEIARGVPAQRIVIAGFSQGGAIALHAGARLTIPLAGVLALSTYLPLHETVADELTAAGRATPILMCHGDYDTTLPLKLGADSRDGLRALGCTVEWRQYAMAHQVCAEEIADIATWLRARLA